MNSHCNNNIMFENCQFMKYNTVIFDLDGTLLDTLADLADSVNYSLRKMGFPERTYKEIRSFLGNGTRYLLKQSVPKDTPEDAFEECLKIYFGYYPKNLDKKTAPYDGIINVLEELKENDYKIAVVSNKFDSAVKELCKKYFSDYLEIAIGETKQIKRKPAPDTVYEAMKQLNAKKEECIYVGDSEVDVQTSKNAGISCIGVTWGFRTREVLEKEGAEYVIDTPEEIFEVLK